MTKYSSIALRFRSISLLAFSLALVPLISTVISQTVQKNYRHLLFVKNVKSELGDTVAWLTFKEPDSLKSILQQQADDPCFSLWQSYVWASYDVEQALQALKDAEGCNRLPENQLIWQGNLAWLNNQPTEAVHTWRQLQDTTLLLYAKTVLLGGEKEIGFIIIDILSQRAAEKRPVAANGTFFAALADLYRYAGQEDEGLPYHLLAWQAEQRSYEQAFYLGRSLADVDRCQEAIDVFREGYSQKPNSLRPFLDYSYYVDWGSCYATLGYIEQARETYKQAYAVLIEAKNLSRNSESYQQQFDRLETLQTALEN